MEQYGDSLTLVGSTKWKGTEKDNGMLLKIHDFSFTSGPSRVVPVTGVNVEFGCGGFHDAADKTNTVYMAASACSTPVFAGIFARSPAIASGQPSANDKILDYNKTELVKEGFVRYKTGYKANEASAQDTFADISLGMSLFISNTNGRYRFASGNALTGYTWAGRIIEVNPDDKSWVVAVSVSKSLEISTASLTAIEAAVDALEAADLVIDGRLDALETPVTP